MNVQNVPKVSYPDNPPAGYRFLLKGERIREGDKVYNTYGPRPGVLSWDYSHCAGEKVGDTTGDLSTTPWVRPLFTPPDGYRRLEWNEKIEVGDHYWTGLSPRPSGDPAGRNFAGQSPVAWLSKDLRWGWVRPNPVEAPKPADEPFGPSRVILPAGYRWLRLSEKIEPTDFWFSVSCLVGGRPIVSCPYREFLGADAGRPVDKVYGGYARRIEGAAVAPGTPVARLQGTPEIAKPAEKSFLPHDPAAKVPAGYRWLEPTETVQEGDRYYIFSPTGGLSDPKGFVGRSASDWFSDERQTRYGWVRPVAPKPRIDCTKLTIPAGYRELTAGEKIQPFDQYLHGKTWKAREGTKRVGHAYRPDECSVTVRATIYQSTDAVASEPGYRFLNLGEKLVKGDQCFYEAWGTTSGWRDGRAVGDPGYACIYRRKTPTPAPRTSGILRSEAVEAPAAPAPVERKPEPGVYPGEGYRFLDVGEKIQHGDRIIHVCGMLLDAGEHIAGSTVNPASQNLRPWGHYARKIEAPAPATPKPTSITASWPPAPAGYRYLVEGEKVQVGDRYIGSDGFADDGEDSDSHFIGTHAVGWLHEDRFGAPGTYCWTRKIEVPVPVPAPAPAPKPFLVTRRLPSGRTVEVFIDRPRDRLELRIVTPDRRYVLQKGFTKAGAAQVRDALNEALNS